MLNEIFWHNLIDLGYHFGAHWSLKGSPNRPFWYEINIKSQASVSRKAFEHTYYFWMDFWCQNERPWRAKTIISYYACCNLRDFAGSWNNMKIGCLKASTIDGNRSLERTRVVCYDFEMFCEVLVFFFFGVRQKVGPQSGNIWHFVTFERGGGVDLVSTAVGTES